MTVFVAGATGVMGRALVSQLVARGHEVVGMTRSPAKQDLLRSVGARPVVADALDPDAVATAVASAAPEVIVHQLTALSGPISMRDARHPERFSGTIMTNRLRTEATDHLLAAGRAAGARRFVAQSFGAFRFGCTGGPVQTEDDPLDPDQTGPRQPGLEAIVHLEHAVTTIGWVRASRCAMAPSTAPEPRSASLPMRPSRDRSASAGSRSSATAVASPHTSTSRTLRLRPSPPSRGPGRRLQPRRRRPRPRTGGAPRAGECAGRQAAETCPALAGSSPGR